MRIEERKLPSLRYWVALGCVLLLLPMACSDGNVSYGEGDEYEMPPEFATPQGGLEIVPHVDFVEIPHGLDHFVEFDEENSVIRVTGEAMQYVAGARSYDVLFGDIHGGFGVHITDVVTSPNEIAIHHRPLEFINIVHGEWDMVIDMEEYAIEGGEDDINSLQQGLFSASGWRQDFNMSRNGFTANAGLGVRIIPQLEFNGKIEVKAGPVHVVNEEFGGATCDNEPFNRSAFFGSAKVCADSLEMSLGAEFTAHAELIMSAALSAGASVGDTINGPNIPAIPLVGPLSLKPRITLTIEASASATASGTLSAGVNASYYPRFGFRWHHRNGLSGIYPSSGPTFSFPVEAEANIDLNAGFELRADISFDLSIRGLERYVGIGGIGAGARLNGDASYRPLDTQPCAEAGVTLTPYLGGSVTAWVDASRARLGEHEFTLIESVGLDFGSFTLASWDDGGQFCLSGDERLAAELTQLFSQDCSDPRVNPFLDSCIEDMIQTCFTPPEHGCQGYVDDDRNIMLTWPTGERLEMRRAENGDITVDEAELFDEDGELCTTAAFSFRTSNFGDVEENECATAALIQLEQNEEPEGGIDDLDEDELDELEEMYEEGLLYKEGDGSGYCINWPEPSDSRRASNPYTLDIFCPDDSDNEEGISLGTVLQNNGGVCQFGIRGCNFSFVSEMPEESLGANPW